MILKSAWTIDESRATLLTFQVISLVVIDLVFSEKLLDEHETALDKLVVVHA